MISKNTFRSIFSFEKGKNIFFFIILFSLFLTYNSTKAQCPSGWTSATVTVVIDGTCDYTITYCYKHYPISNVVEITIAGIYINPGCGSTFTTDSTFWNEANKRLLKHLCSVSIFPPCPTQSGQVSISRKSCFSVTWSDPINSQISMLPCNDETECRKNYYVCCQPNNEPLITYISTSTSGSPNCTELTSYTLPAPQPFGTTNPTCYYYPCE